MLEVETVNSKKTTDKNVKLAKVFKALSSNIEKNNELLNRLLELTLESESNHQGLAPLRSILSKSLSAQREDKVTVEIKLTFLKINDIDTVDQRFQSEIFIQAKWHDHLITPDEKIFEPSMMWTPKLIILNIDGSIKEEHIDYSIVHSNDDNPPRVQLMWRFKAFFKENLELQHFPVDVQDLTISISTERSIHEIEIIEDQTSLSSVNTQAFLDASEWNLYNHTESFRGKTTVENASSTVHPILHIQCRVARKIGYFVWNIIFIVVCNYYNRAPLCGCPIVISLSVRPSVHPSVCPSEISCPMESSLPLAQSGSHFTHRVPLGKGGAVALNPVSRSKLKIKAELYEKLKNPCPEHIFSPP